MTQLLTSNISFAEQTRRYAIGAALIALVLANSAFPAWLSLLACYPIFTALIQWDPVNFLIQRVINRFSKRESSFMLNRTTTA